MALALAASCAVIVAGPSAWAQESPDVPPPEIEKLIQQGLGEALQSRIGATPPTPPQLHWLALAFRNKATRIKEPVQRQAAFEEAERRYRAWSGALERARTGEVAQRIVNLAAARAELAEMISSQWASLELDQFEISNGARGDRKLLYRLLTLAREELSKVRSSLEPLVADLAHREEDLLALGIYDRLNSLRVNGPYQLAWTSLFAALVEPPPAEHRGELLKAAETIFTDLTNADSAASVHAQSNLGLGIVNRELKRYPEATRHFRAAQTDDASPVFAAQLAYEHARSLIAEGKFSEARSLLAALLAKDPQKLSNEERPAAFYYNLAKLWDADSYLLESDAQRREAATSTARVALLQLARDTRQIGLTRLNHLSEQGGPWPAVVRLFISASIDPNADPRTLSGAELIFVAQQLSDAKRYREAADRLREAAARADLDPKSLGEALFDLGMCYYRLDDTRAAAETFARVAADHRSHAKAPEAATNAYQLWAKLATQTKEKADYEKLAAVLLNLVQSFPDHEKRVDATWWLPLALQGAGRLAEAAEQFAKVPADSPRGAEALFRRVQCERQALEAARDKLQTADYAARVTKLAEQTAAQAKQSLAREALAALDEPTRNWIGETLLAAAELYQSPGVEQFAKSLESLKDFEQRFTNRDLVGRMLAVRIRAYRGLRQMDEAAKAVRLYLAAAPKENAGPVLSTVAQGVQEELERLRQEGKTEEARKLAADAIPTFQELLKWCESDAQRAAEGDIVAFGLARLLHISGQHDPALKLIDKLLAKEAQNGHYQRLRALILTARLPETAPTADVEQASDSWAALLKDAGLRTRAPERYWEARFHWLRLQLRLGRAADVEKAIRQERIWRPDLGGPPWREFLEALHQQAAEKAGVKPAERPASQPTKRP